MNSVKNHYNRNQEDLQDKCRKSMYFHIVLTMKDGRTLDGIIEKVEPESIIALVGEDVLEDEEENEDWEDRQIFSYGRPRRRFRRFRRRRIPFGSLAALALLPYPYPPYSNYPPYPYYPDYDYYKDYDKDEDDDDHDHHHHGNYYSPYNSYY